MKFDKFKVVCSKCKKIIEENECPACNKINNWSNTGFYCNMECYYLLNKYFGGKFEVVIHG